MTYLIVLLLLVVAGALTYLATLPGDYSIRRSLSMAVPRQAVFDKVRDFHTWPEWSPWLIHEPETHLEFSTECDREGGYYSWDGKRVGAGKITHERFVDNEKIEQRIEFTRPFKSVCRVWWEFDTLEGQTLVSWCMEGRMPFLFRFMTATTQMMIEKDYDLGLAMLRGKLDPTAEHPQISFHGETERDPLTALTIPFAGHLDAMVTAMQEGFPKLGAYAEQQGIEPIAPPLTAYHKVDPKKGYFECDMALPVGEGVEAAEFSRKVFDGGRYFEVELKGSYDFLELAWYSTMGHLRMAKLKQDGARSSFEVYANDPEGVAHSNEIVTRLYVPVK